MSERDDDIIILIEDNNQQQSPMIKSDFVNINVPLLSNSVIIHP